MRSSEPKKEDILMFLDVVGKLSLFEAEHRNIRGWGLFSEERGELPFPAVIRVQKWLQELAEDKGVDGQSCLGDHE